jgi:hypothetical protein
MASIFISYRRIGALVHARALFERLRNEFGPGEVFIDLEGIEYGVDFVDILNKQLNGCQVMMAIIDPHWATAADKQGRRRIDREYDYVRTEIVAALARGIRTVPVLIDGAEMPDPADLPEPLRPLTRRNALMLDFNQFDAEIGRLISEIRKILATSAPTTSIQPVAEPSRALTSVNDPKGGQRRSLEEQGSRLQRDTAKRETVARPLAPLAGSVALFVRELAPRAWLQEHRLLVRGGALIVGVVLLAIAAIFFRDYVEDQLLKFQSRPRIVVRAQPLTPEQQRDIDDKLYLANQSLEQAKTAQSATDVAYLLSEGANNVNDLLSDVLTIDPANEQALQLKGTTAHLYWSNARALFAQHKLADAMKLVSYGTKVAPESPELFKLKRDICDRDASACAAN